MVPSEYDQAFQDVRDGVIVGGLAPQLVNLTAKARPEVLEVLDPTKQAHKIASDAAEAARIAREHHERILAEQTAKLAAAEATIAQTQATTAKSLEQAKQGQRK
jgi:hypothetical protein